MSAAQAARGGGAPLRLGLIGAGPWGRAYARTIARLEGVVLAAVASRNPATASVVGDACAVHANWEALLEESLDGAIVASPPASHLPIASRFAEAGVPVLVEKPLCLDLASALVFRELAARRRATVMVGHVHLFSPAYRLLKQLSPALGRITGIVSAGGREGPVRPDTPALWDFGPHDLGMALDLLGAEPRAVAARRTFDRPAPGGREENFDLALELPGPVTARIAVGNAMPRVRRLEVAHERGTLVYDDLAQRKLAYRPEGARPDETVREAIAACAEFRLPLDCLVEEFRDAIQAGRADPRPLDLAVSVVRVLELADRAAR